MDLMRFYRRLASHNPVEPYSWVAVYRDGTMLRQFDVDGFHWSRDIACARLHALVILGHPYSPIEVPVLTADRGPDAVIIKTTTDIVITLGAGDRLITYDVRYFFGYRYGPDVALVEIDSQGHLYKTNHDGGSGDGQGPDRWTGGGF